MSQSLAKDLIHLTFSTEDREPSLTQPVREGLHRYMAGISNRLPPLQGGREFIDAYPRALPWADMLHARSVPGKPTV